MRSFVASRLYYFIFHCALESSLVVFGPRSQRGPEYISMYSCSESRATAYKRLCVLTSHNTFCGAQERTQRRERGWKCRDRGVVRGDKRAEGRNTERSGEDLRKEKKEEREEEEENNEKRTEGTPVFITSVRGPGHPRQHRGAITGHPA